MADLQFVEIYGMLAIECDRYLTCVNDMLVWQKMCESKWTFDVSVHRILLYKCIQLEWNEIKYCFLVQFKLREVRVRGVNKKNGSLE